MAKPPTTPLFLLLSCAATSCATDSSTDEVPSCTGGKCDGIGPDGFVDPCENLQIAGDIADKEYDFIVVGSGAGGGPLAANLALRGHQVLLLEAGEEMGKKLEYRVPQFSLAASEDPDLAWSYHVKHYGDPNRESPAKLESDKYGDKGIFYPRGSALGGSTAVNALITMYPHDSDWKHLQELTGDDTWSPAAMRDRWENLERRMYGGAPEMSGWLPTQLNLPLFPDLAIADIILGAVTEAEGPIGGVGALLDLILGVRDVNSPDRDDPEGMDGTGTYAVPSATRDGVRSGPRELICQAKSQRAGFDIKTNALVTNLVFAGEPAPDGTCDDACKTVVGAEFIDAKDAYRADKKAAMSGPLPAKQTVHARKEVVLSAGAFNTPQLLMLSGIGPRAQLEQHQVPVRIDSPGVGQNLQDRYEVGVVFDVVGSLTSDPKPFSALSSCTFNPQDLSTDNQCLLDWLDDGGGILSSAAVGIFGRSQRVVDRCNQPGGVCPDADLFVFGGPTNFPGYSTGYSKRAFENKNKWTWAILKAHTENTAGTVELRSTDPRDTPLINFKYFDEGTNGAGEADNDLEAVVDAIEFVRKMGTAADGKLLFKGKAFKEVLPGPSVETRAELATWVKSEAWGHHACGTAKIGTDSDPTAVLDTRYRVRGANRLRVVDASVFPKIPGFFIVVPIYMVSERAAELIHEDNG